MSDRKDAQSQTAMGRRDFLKLLGVGGAALATGCAPEVPDLVPYVRPPENIVAGKATYFATTCRECPAGCGVLAKNMDGRTIKLEGNPLHPVNQGRLCPRGQAALTGLYNPDRLRQPMIRQPNGKNRKLEWPEAYSILNGYLARLKTEGRRGIAFLTPVVTGTLRDLIAEGLKRAGARYHAHIMYEALSYDALAEANRAVFGQRVLPTYHIDEADFLISLNADFLETWLSTVEYAWRFARFHQTRAASKNLFVYVGPRRSLTAANADHVIDVAPGREYLAGLALLKIVMQADGAAGLAEDDRTRLRRLLAPYDMDALVGASGAAEEDLRRVAARFVKARKPLVLAGGNRMLVPNAEAAAVAAALLCALKPESRALIDFEHAHALGDAATGEQMLELTERLRHKEIDLLLVHDVNPAFSLPATWQFDQALAQVPAVVSFSSYPNETSRHAHLHLPAHTFLESWGDYQARRGIRSLMQPTMGPVFDTRPLAEMIAATMFQIQPAETPVGMEMLQAAWQNLWEADRTSESFRTFWVQSLRRGGLWAESPVRRSVEVAFEGLEQAMPDPSPPSGGHGVFECVVYPTIQFYDGRMANRPWIQELPDPITQVTWGGWVEMHPEDARTLGVEKGDLLSIVSPFGRAAFPVLPIYSVPSGRVALPIGQGHTHFGRFADLLPDNPFQVVPIVEDARGHLSAQAFKVTLAPGGKRFPIADTDGSYTEQGRHILQTESLDEFLHKKASGHRPDITPPLPGGYLPERDFYPPHEHLEYRWAMVVDLDRCIGCSACVIACYAENNVAYVGRDQMLKMREMSWIRVQRYFKPGSWRAGWLVMLCQHCDSAPCESVCPIFAPQHSKEGLNNQVYNRCFGTRFCSQNDPYKVRRFNWYTWKRAEPLQFQLNPDVTVRQKGIMEKCSFCIQRIVAAKIEARNEDRLVRDGDFTTACAQTCPTEALIFGNLLDPDSRVAKLLMDARAYQVLHHLNTKPAVIYLKKITQKL